MRRGLLALAIVVLHTGCASIKTTSQVAPGVTPPSFDTLLIAAVTSDLRLRRLAESSFVRAAAEIGSVLVPYHAVFLPGRHVEEAYFVAELRRRGIKGVLIVRDVTTDPATVTGSAVAIPLCSRSVAGRCVQGTTVITGGQHATQTKFTIESQLVDLDSNEPVWIGSTRIERNGASDNDLIEGLGRDIVETLVKLGLLKSQFLEAEVERKGAASP